MKPFSDYKNNKNYNLLNRTDYTTHIYLYFTFKAALSINYQTVS